MFGLAILVQLYTLESRIATMQLALLLPIIALLDIAPQIGLGAFGQLRLVFYAPVFIASVSPDLQQPPQRIHV